MFNQSLHADSMQRRVHWPWLHTIIERHPFAVAVAIWFVDVLLAVIVGIVATALLPSANNAGSDAPGIPDLIALLAVTMFDVILVSLLSWWRVIGFNQLADWRNPKLLLLPLFIALLPLAWGLNVWGFGVTAFFVIGYALTGFREELLYRGIILRVLGPMGMWTAVLISTLLFSLAHSANLVLRFSGNPGAVLLQMLGTFVVGIGLAALRLRTNTLWGVIVLHMLLDLFLRLGQAPMPMIAIAQGVVLVLYGLYLLRNRQIVAQDVTYIA